MQGKWILGIDIGGTKLAVVLARADGEIVERYSELTEASQRTPETILASLAEKARDMLRRAEIRKPDVRGVGISCGGPLDTRTGVIFSPPNLPTWVSVPVRQFFENALDLPTRVENDANATALAEWRFGAGKGAQNLVFLTMGTGIGGGIILDGRLVRGANDLAGEVGHQTILPEGPLCGCGKRGCLEALASGPSIARFARENRGYGRERRVLALAGGDLAQITAVHVVESAKEGDPYAIGILNDAATYMGIGIANLIQILNPERIILGTLAVHAGDLLLKPIRAAVEKYAWARSVQACQILPASLGDRAQDLAAVALWLQESED